MFLRCYATSLKRPWLKSAKSAFDDARYRLSVPLAAPFVVLMAAVVLIVKTVNPLLLSSRTAALLICFSLIAGGVGVYVILGRFFESYSKNSEVALQFDEPLSGVEIALQVILWTCVATYCLLMIFV
jgi:hypothetical protein